MYEKEVAEIENLIEKQNRRRDKCINLIASENVVSQRVRSQAGSDFAHRYAEGHPGERYYRGTSYTRMYITATTSSNKKISNR